MFIGGIKVGKLHNIDIFERDAIIATLPNSLKYSYKCIRNEGSLLSQMIKAMTYGFLEIKDNQTKRKFQRER